LEEQIQLANAKKKEIAKQKEAKVMQDAEMTKWKALTME
jgi:hypothetical protein